ncbi:hypothetical protein FA13DRAFT_65083 [Coprinellus micaceus]|uniref:Cyclin N-terminal domain-containing protein n=1 Tax=Coprinellus micaceus TaxID=71717 RepID=A0A4Y7TIR9_COPMI|nr:hypothetical protein FA13DRAFT_65083 [Coprinellus micaceus]
MRPSLTISEQPTYSTPFCEDPWPGDDEDDYLHGPVSVTSSRTSSSNSHVLPESAFLGADGRYLLDPYIGFGDIAKLASGHIIKTFHAQEETNNTRSRGQPKLSIFVAQLIYLTAAPYNAVIASLILLQRFKAKLSAAHSNTECLAFSGHMLWLGAFMIACNEDSMRGVVPNAGSAAYWSELSLFTEREVDEVYRELWNELDGNVTVFPSYASALEKLKNPIQLPPSFRWKEELWNLGGGDDDDDSDSSEEGGALVKASAAPTKTSRQVPPRATPQAKSKLASPPGSPRTFALGSRLVSLFKKKA